MPTPNSFKWSLMGQQKQKVIIHNYAGVRSVGMGQCICILCVIGTTSILCAMYVCLYSNPVLVCDLT